MLGMKMAIAKSKVSLFLVILMTVVLALYLASDRIVIYLFSKACDLDISYKDIKRRSATELEFKELTVLDKRIGLGIFSHRATLRPVWKLATFKSLQVTFDLNGVSFVKQEPASPESYNSLPALVAMPFHSRWTYREVNGSIVTSPDGIDIRDFMGTGDLIKLSLKGKIYYDNRINTDVTIYFSNELTKKIPEDLSKLILQEAENGWKSLPVTLAGNYKTPSIQVSGKLFRLNIKTISE